MSNAYTEVDSAIEDLGNRITKLVRDAVRYSWLRDEEHWPAVFASSDAPEALRGEELDAAIDLAMKELE